MTSFRLYLYVEERESSHKNNLIDALKILKSDFEVVQGLSLEWSIEYLTKAEAIWEKNQYTGQLIRHQDMNKLALGVKKLSGEKYHSIVLFLRDENWVPKQWGGINVGSFFQGMSFQLCRWYNTSQFLWEVLTEEVTHCLDEQIYRETGKKVEDYLMIQGDADDVIVHGEGIGWVRKKYRPYYEKIAPLLLQTFQKRNERWEKELKMKVSLLKTIKGLYERIIFLKREIEKRKHPIV